VVAVRDRKAQLEDGHDRRAALGYEPKLVEMVDRLAVTPGQGAGIGFAVPELAALIREARLEGPEPVEVRCGQ